MTAGTAEHDDVDFILVAWREEGEWSVCPLPPSVTGHLAVLVVALRQLPAEGGALALVSLGDATFLVVRVRGALTRMLVADPDLAEDCPLGREVVDALVDAGAHLVPDDGPWLGDLGLLDDLGIAPAELRSLCEDDDAYPDERLAVLAGHLGIGPAFDRALAALA